MYLVCENSAVVGCGGFPSKDGNKQYYNVTLSVGGKLVKLPCDQKLHAKAESLLLKQGTYHVMMQASEYAGRTSFTAVDISLAK